MSSIIEYYILYDSSRMKAKINRMINEWKLNYFMVVKGDVNLLPPGSNRIIYKPWEAGKTITYMQSLSRNHLAKPNALSAPYYADVLITSHEDGYIMCDGGRKRCIKVMCEDPDNSIFWHMFNDDIQFTWKNKSEKYVVEYGFECVIEDCEGNKLPPNFDLLRGNGDENYYKRKTVMKNIIDT